MRSEFEAWNTENIVAQNVNADRLAQELLDFGLTTHESRTYIHLAKHGSKKASEISRSLNIMRTETYHILKSLQNKGLVTASFEHPFRFNAAPFNKALKLLIRIQKEHLRTLKARKTNIVDLWKSLPELDYSEPVYQPSFQILKGLTSISAKARDMLARAKKEFLVLGDEKDYMRLYHFELLDDLAKSEHEIIVNFLMRGSSNSLEAFKTVNLETVRTIRETIDLPCYIIADQSELLFFMQDERVKSKDVVAIWTNSAPLAEAMRMLFHNLRNDSIPLPEAANKQVIEGLRKRITDNALVLETPTRKIQNNNG